MKSATVCVADRKTASNEFGCRSSAVFEDERVSMITTFIPTQVNDSANVLKIFAIFEYYVANFLRTSLAFCCNHWNDGSERSVETREPLSRYCCDLRRVPLRISCGWLQLPAERQYDYAFFFFLPPAPFAGFPAFALPLALAIPPFTWFPRVKSRPCWQLATQLETLRSVRSQNSGTSI